MKKKSASGKTDICTVGQSLGFRISWRSCGNNCIRHNQPLMKWRIHFNVIVVCIVILDKNCSYMSIFPCKKPFNIPQFPYRCLFFRY